MLKNFNYSQVPNGYAHCFNDKCKKAEECLRHQITYHIPEDIRTIIVLNPVITSPKGECKEFIPCVPQKNAVGITHLLDNLPYSTARDIKNELILHITERRITTALNGKKGSLLPWNRTT